MVKAKLKFEFHGGAQGVTGANHLLIGTSSAGKETRVLVDCGLFQGVRMSEKRNHDAFSYNPSAVDALFITHAHLDHIGRIPKLIHDGFKGKIYSTAPCKDFARLMLADSLGILTREVRKRGGKMIYIAEDIDMAMSQWETVEYHEEIKVGDFGIVFKEAGHILGSAMVEFVFADNSLSSSEQVKIVYTGDLGNSPNPLLRDMESLSEDVDYLIIESAYGDRSHEQGETVSKQIERVIEDTIHRGGVLMIPAFSLERTQKLLFDINNLVENGRIPQIPIFLDSPLAIKATRVYKQYKQYYNERAMDIIRSGDDLFQFPGLKMTLNTSESKAIKNVPAPKIIIAGSGMSAGGRIIHHEKLYLSDPNSTLFLIGYQGAGTLGRKLLEGEKRVRLYGEEVSVKAHIEMLSGYSAHADMDQLYELVRGGADSLKKVFVVQGEPKASMFFAQRVKDYLGINAIAPEIGESFEVEV